MRQPFMRKHPRRGGAIKSLIMLVLLAAVGGGIYYAVKAGNVKFQQARVAKVVEMVPPDIFMKGEPAMLEYIYRNIKSDAPEVAIEKSDIKVSRSGHTLKVNLNYSVHVDAGPLSRTEVISEELTKSFEGYAMTPIMKAHDAAGQMDQYHQRQQQAGGGGGGGAKDKAANLRDSLGAPPSMPSD